VLTHADGHTKRQAANEMVKRQKGRRKKRITVVADKGYDASDFVQDMRELNVTQFFGWAKIDALAINVCHARMPLSAIHDLNTYKLDSRSESLRE
jgi:hypothetical protein